MGGGRRRLPKLELANVYVYGYRRRVSSGDGGLPAPPVRARVPRGRPRTLYVRPRDEPTWQAAEALAVEGEVSLSTVVSDALTEYVRRARQRAEHQARKAGE